MRTPFTIGRAGFSAVEMLVAGLLGAIVMTATAQFFSFQLSTLRVERTRRSAQMVARTTLNFIVRQLEHAGRDPQGVLFSNIDNPALPPAIVAADGDSIRYRTNLSEDPTDNDTDDPWEDATFDNQSGVIRVAQGVAAPVAMTDGTKNGSHVPANGLVLTYFDGAGAPVVDPLTNAALASIRRVAISVTVIGGEAATATADSPRVTLSQDVFLRNLS
jgi:Tfp pilus assembly protein PilW